MDADAGIVLAIASTLLASIACLNAFQLVPVGLAVAGFAGLYSFNYILLVAGVRGTAAITRTAGRYFERWSATTPLSASCSTCVSTPSANCLCLPGWRVSSG